MDGLAIDDADRVLAHANNLTFNDYYVIKNGASLPLLRASGTLANPFFQINVVTNSAAAPEPGTLCFALPILCGGVAFVRRRQV